jgi:hypothetical protein
VEEIVRQDDIAGGIAEMTQPEPFPPLPAVEQPQTIRDALREVPGVQHVYRISNDGQFHGQATAEQFKKAYSAIFKGIQELLTIFDELPGPGPKRRPGVYEVERDRLYLISMGDECLFVTVRRAGPDIDYEQALKKAAFGEWGPDYVED